MAARVRSKPTPFRPFKRDWAGRTVYLIGGGPSLRGFDFARLAGRGPVVAINDAFRNLPFPAVAFSIDTHWLGQRRNELESYPGEVVLALPAMWDKPLANAHHVKRVTATGVSAIPDMLFTGENSGFAAMGMAIMRGAARIVMLGYDLTTPGHWHAGYGWRSRYGHADYPRWVRNFDSLEAECTRRRIEVFNCNGQSAIRCFPLVRFEELPV